MVLIILFHSCKVLGIVLTRVSPHITARDGRELNKCAVTPWASFKSQAKSQQGFALLQNLDKDKFSELLQERV